MRKYTPKDKLETCMCMSYKLMYYYNEILCAYCLFALLYEKTVKSICLNESGQHIISHRVLEKDMM